MSNQQLGRAQTVQLTPDKLEYIWRSLAPLKGELSAEG